MFSYIKLVFLKQDMCMIRESDEQRGKAAVVKRLFYSLTN